MYPIYFYAILERDVPPQVSDELSLDDLEAGEEIDLEHEIPKDVEPIGPAVEGDKYQGDEILTAEQKAELGIADRDGMESELEMRQAITRATRKWPKKDGKVYVPYELGTHFSANEKAVMSRGFEEYAKHTCIRYPNWIQIYFSNHHLLIQILYLLLSLFILSLI